MTWTDRSFLFVPRKQPLKENYRDTSIQTANKNHGSHFPTEFQGRKWQIKCVARCVILFKGLVDNFLVNKNTLAKYVHIFGTLEAKKLCTYTRNSFLETRTICVGFIQDFLSCICFGRKDLFPSEFMSCVLSINNTHTKEY